MFLAVCNFFDIFYKYMTYITIQLKWKWYWRVTKAKRFVRGV